METLILWLLVVIFVGAFAAQVATRVRLIAAAPNTFSIDRLGARVSRFLVDVIGQRATIAERPLAGLGARARVLGFLAFGGYTTVEFLRGLGIVDLTATALVRGLPDGADAVCGRRARRHRCAGRSAARGSAGRARRPTCRWSRWSSRCSSPR